MPLVGLVSKVCPRSPAGRRHRSCLRCAEGRRALRCGFSSLHCRQSHAHYNACARRAAADDLLYPRLCPSRCAYVLRSKRLGPIPTRRRTLNKICTGRSPAIFLLSSRLSLNSSLVSRPPRQSNSPFRNHFSRSPMTLSSRLLFAALHFGRDWP